MTRCLIFIASLSLALIAIASTASATPSELGHGSDAASLIGKLRSDSGVAAWSTFAPSRQFTFVEIAL